MLSKIGILLANLAVVYALTCHEVLELSPEKKFTLAELQSIPQKDLVQCLVHLAKQQMLRAEADFIWHSIIFYYNGTANIPDDVLISLNWVTVAVTPEDYANITLNNIEVITNFGHNYNLDESQLATIADRVRDDFAGKKPEDYTTYDLLALSQILCAFNRSEIERIHAEAYRDAAQEIGNLKHCNAEVMSGFGTLAVQDKAFGSPHKWTSELIKFVGKVAEHLPN